MNSIVKLLSYAFCIFLIFFLLQFNNLTWIWNGLTQKISIDSSKVASDTFHSGMKNIFIAFGQDYMEYSLLSDYSFIHQFKGEELQFKENRLFSTAMDEICQGIANDENFHVNYKKVQERQKEIDELVIAKLADNDLIQKHETSFKQNIWLLQVEILQKYKTKKIAELNLYHQRILQQVLTFEISQTKCDEAKKEALNMKLSFLDEYLIVKQQNENTINPRCVKAHDLNSCSDVTLEECIPDVGSKSIIEYERDYFNYMKKLSISDENNATIYNALKNEIYEIIVKWFYTAMNEYSKE